MATLVADTAAIRSEALAGDAITAEDGTVMHVGRLSLNQWGALARLSIGAIDKLPAERGPELKAMADKFKAQGAESLTPAEMGQAAVTFLMPLLDQASINGLFSILTGQPADWCGNTLGIDEIVAVLTAALTRNPPERFAALFRQAGAAISSVSSPKQRSDGPAS